MNLSKLLHLDVCLKTSSLSGLGESFKMSETISQPLVSSRHERYVLGPKSSRRRAEDTTTIFRTNSYFRMCKEFYAPYFILFISNYLYLSLIISNYTSARALSYLCDRIRREVTDPPPCPSTREGSSYNRHLWKSCRISVICVQFTAHLSPLITHYSLLITHY